MAAPSRIRPAADRVKTDRRDAERLARLLRLGEITPVRVPEPEEEAARDLVRAREDARGDLMRARHRLSKLLLRHGLVYDATAWTRPTTRGFAGSGSRAGRSRSCSTSATAGCSTRRPGETRSTRRSPSSPRASRTSMSSGGSSVCAASRTLTAFALTVELGDWHRFRPESLGAVPRPHPERELKRRAPPPRRDHQDRQHARAPAPDRGRLAPPPPAAAASRSNADAQASQRRCEPKPTAAPAGCTAAGTRSRPEASPARSSSSPSRASSPDTAGRSRHGVADHRQRLGEESAPAQRREERPENTASSPHGPRSTPESGTAPHRTPGHAATNPRI